MKFKHLFKENNILRAVYLLVFLFIITNEAIYSPDTRSYLNALPYRHPVYVLFVKSFKALFSTYFDLSVLAFQALFSLFAIDFFLKRIEKTFSLHLLTKAILVIVLLFPLFQPLSIANNICPEGISYPLYLIFIASSLDFILNNTYKTLWLVSISFIILALTRGQFILTPLIFACIYSIKNRSQIFKSPVATKLIILICLPVVVVIAESTYHKLKDGIFMTTPFGFVAASGAPFFVSQKTDANSIENVDDRLIFDLCYTKLEKEGLLISSQTDLQSYSEYYDFFHNHVPPICNRTIHAIGKKYYYEKYIENKKTSNYAHAQAYYNIEKTCRNITLTLIKNNFSSWLKLYFYNVSHGFYSSYIFLLMILLFIVSGIKFLVDISNKWYTLLFICTALILSNALLVAFASHSIMRYLFYNYAILIVLVVILIKLIKNEIRN